MTRCSPEVSTPENRGRIGGIGVGIGYLGSYVAIGMGLLLGVDTLPKLVRLFSFIAIGFLIFAIPCFLFVKERGNPHPRPITLRMALESTRETIRTLRSSQQYPGLLRFLIGRIFYTDGINTVIAIMGIYTVNVARSAAQMTVAAAKQQGQLILLTAITFAVVGGFFWGWLTDRIGPKRTLNFVLLAWMGIFAFAALIGIAGLPLSALYVVACMAGFALGGIWAADRPYIAATHAARADWRILRAVWNGGAFLRDHRPGPVGNHHSHPDHERRHGAPGRPGHRHHRAARAHGRQLRDPSEGGRRAAHVDRQ